MLRNLMNDEAGFVVSAELVLILTLVFCAVAVGIGVIKDSLAQEMGDVAEAIGALDQTYAVRSLSAPLDTGGGTHARCAGAGFNDEADDCDCKGIELGVPTIKNDPSTLNRIEGT